VEFKGELWKETVKWLSYVPDIRYFEHHTVWLVYRTSGTRVWTQLKTRGVDRKITLKWWKCQHAWRDTIWS